MPIPTNDDMLFDMNGETSEIKSSDDITLPTEDKEDKKEDAPADEKKEVKGDEPTKPEDAKPEDTKPEDKKEEDPKEDPKPEDKKEEDPDDLDLSDLFADLDEASKAGDESKKILDDAARA